MKNSILPIILFLLITPALTHASNAVPKYVTLQAVLTDDGGRVVSEQIQQSDFTFRIVDSSGNIIFEEEQKKVPVVRGAISVLVGSGTEGGIPIEALAPDGDKLLQIQMGNHTIPQEDLQLVSVPYALYADAIAGGVDTDDIVDATITAADLSAELLASLGNLGNTNTEVLTADLIPVENIFVNMNGTNVQSILQGIDFAITIDKEDIKNIQKDITTIQSQQPTLAPGQKLDDIYVNVTGDTINGTITATNFVGDGSQITNINGTNIQTDSITTTQIKDGTISLPDLNTASFSSWDQNSADDVTTSTNFAGDVSGTYNALVLGSNTVGTNEVTNSSLTGDDLDFTSGSTTIDGRYVKKSGGTMTGSLTMGSTADIVMATNRTVDGVDVSALETTVNGLVQTNASAGSIFSYGSMTGSTIADGYAVRSSVTRSGSEGGFEEAYPGAGYNTCTRGDYSYEITFSTARSDSNYFALIIPYNGTTPSVVKSDSGFTVTLNTSKSDGSTTCTYAVSGKFSFMVLEN